MQTEPAFNENELAQRWNVSPKTLQRWRSEGVGPPYLKLSRAIRYPVSEIVNYEQASHHGLSNDAPLPSLIADPPPAEPPAPEPKKYYLKEAFALIAQYGSLEAAEAALTEVDDETQD
ncbi:AlpA family transcriptional regulator [Pseudomonas sp.]|uniref:helix-turn-helix transcriptional regulator n=1 Tax=Pseudomonas sp. TaxID=306 RepID=UPI0026DAD911|nr:helix-turn-helix domain-containing protein [Pseudomonas sp.]MDO4236730.1 helix-turn-helix domain-containing protein [Pseudomonas sp.]